MPSRHPLSSTSSNTSSVTPLVASPLTSLEKSIVACHRCVRLREHCQRIARLKRRAYLDDTYWGKPITGFGDPAARVMIVGLAPAAHGANRTGRIFTGDRSGDWLYRALFKAGFANQEHCVNREDGLTLKDVYVTCVVKCAPPDNKPTPIEQSKCSPYLLEELRLLPQVQVWIALGQISLNGLWPLLRDGLKQEPKQGLHKHELKQGLKLDTTQRVSKPKFQHGAKIALAPGKWLLLSYHPSQQNTFTGRLTEPMFDSVFKTAKELLESE